jgi:hypothetical protein
MWNVISSSSKGRMAVAKEDIKRGTLIHVELPTAYVPFTDVKSSRTSNYAFSTFEKSMLTAASAATGANYKGFTSILAARVITATYSNKLADDQVKYLCRKSTLSRRKGTNDSMLACAQIVQRLLLGTTMGTQESTESCHSTLEKLECNAFTVVDYDLSSITGIGLYTKAAAINHSCDPNCCQTFNISSSATLSIRAIKDIKKGEEVTIAYIDVGRPTWWRKNELFLSYGFYCSCSRCCSCDSSESYLCSTPNCSGTREIVETDIFSAWKSCGDEEKNEISLPEEIHQDPRLIFDLPIPFGNVFLKNYPYNFHINLNSTSLPFRKLEKTKDRKQLRFQCDRCHTITDGESILIKIFEICTETKAMKKNRQRGKSNVKESKQCIQKLLKLVKQSHYSVVDVYRNFLLEDLLIANDFKSYVQHVRESNYLSSLHLCYPDSHPFPAIQEVIFAKCLLQTCQSENDLIEARMYLHHALKILTVSHGESSSLVTNTIDLFRGT